MISTLSKEFRLASPGIDSQKTSKVNINVLNKSAKSFGGKMLLVFFSVVLFGLQAYAQGTWAPVTRLAPDYNEGVMLLLTDGTVLCKTSSGGTGYGTTWDKLTPDSHGSYVNGTWTTIAPMHDERLYFSSQVLRDGRVYVAGGEYGSGGWKGEVYNPLTNVWTACPQLVFNSGHAISDANSELLPDGRVLQAIVDTGGTRLNRIYDPATNTYALTASCLRVNNEAIWVKLPDNSTVFIDNYGTTSERYIPATNTWINDGTLPVELYDPYGEEAGAAFLLPDGRVFFIGSTPTTAFYTPSGTTSPGTWAAGPAIPGSQGAPDAASAMMVNGKILLMVSPTPYAANHFPDSSTYYEFDYTTNAFTLVSPPFGSGPTLTGYPTYWTNMLDLPNGDVLFCNQGDDQYYQYTPGSAPLTAGKPAVTSITRVNCDTFTATGTLFNGICEGAAYGDDWQMSTNYPIVQLTSGTNVYYARTFNWNRPGAVKTGTLPDTTQFALPAGLPAGTYSLAVIANGNASAPVSFNPGLSVSPASASVCLGNTTTLTGSWSGGKWSSGNTSFATVGSGTGSVTGVAGGAVTITYTMSAGCFATAAVTVNSSTSPITGTTSLCMGSTTTLSDATTGGTWSSSPASSGIATIGSGTGTVTGVAAGTAIITYTTPAGCYTTTTVTVNSSASPIAGSMGVCAGSTTALTDAGGGTWNSSDNTIASVDAVTGVVTGVSPNTATITYSLSAGCTATAIITVNPLPGAISGTGNVCTGLTTILSDGGSGTWSSGNTALAAVDPGTGTVTGVASGTPTVTYTIPTGCFVTTAVTVNPLPSAIAGSAGLCPGSTITLTDAGGGAWSDDGAGVATVSVAGIVTGAALGTATITYTLSTGCLTTTTVTVNSSASPIIGPGSVCVGSNITLSDAGAGTWSASDNTIASIDAVTGIVTGVSANTATITYSQGGGCIATTAITVNPSPGAITGAVNVCVASTTALSDGGTGTWSSSNTTFATIGAGTGIVTGMASGTPVITYTIPTGCFVTTPVVVNPLPSAISGATSVCGGLTTTLSDGGGGTWSSGSPAVASVSVSGTVTGATPGTAIITYALGTGCITTATVTVNPSPAAISGPTTVCAGSSITLTDGGGGTWSSSNTAIASVAGGVVTGGSASTVTITYNLGAGCIATAVITVNPVPAAITGTAKVCAGATTTLADGTTGGAWSSSNTSFATIVSGSGVVTGVATGTPVITYTLATGCIKTTPVTVNPVPAAITGTAKVCAGATTTLADGTTGGTWSSSNTSFATIVSGSGVVTGVVSGTPTITYTLATGCIKTTPVTVNPAPAAITGTAKVCAGLTTTLSDATTGGTWSSSNTAFATIVSGSGVVTGVASGTPAITYALATGCIKTTPVTVNPIPAAITGTAKVCAGATTTLGDATTGGTWSSSNTAFATVVSGSGVVTGVAPGTPTITYTLSTGCIKTTPVTVNPVPAAIGGTAKVCKGLTASLTDATTGGTWSSSSVATATIGSGTGIFGGVAAGMATISYTLATGCRATKVATVNNSPSAITGSSTVCRSSTTTLSDGVTGGTWSSSNTTRATVVAATGVVHGVATGTVTISYTLSGGCTATKTETVTTCAKRSVNTEQTVCAGSAIALTAPTTGGTWMSDDNSIANVDNATGRVTGINPGNTEITYTADDAGASEEVTPIVVYPAPSPVVIIASPGTTISEGQSVTLTANTDADLTYQWLVNGIQVAAADKPIFTSNSFSDNDIISCVATAVCGKLISNTIVITVSNKAVRQIMSGGMDVSMIPNPNNGSFILQGSLGAAGDQDVITEVTDMLGQIVYKGSLTAHDGNINQRIQLNNSLANGMYLLTLHSEQGNLVFHFMIEK